MNYKGSIPIIITVVLSLLALTFVGVGIYYKIEKDENTSSNIDVFNTVDIPCSERAAGLVVVGENTIDCEADDRCILQVGSSCPVCDDVVYTCAENNSAIKSDTSIANTSTVVDETDDWQTYINDELGILFENPQAGSELTIEKIDKTIPENRVTGIDEAGKAIYIKVVFSNSQISITGSSADFNKIYWNTYNGGSDLSKICTNPGVIENNSYCVNSNIDDQDTFDKIFFTNIECSPFFEREVYLNLNNSDYPGLMIHQIYSAPEGYDCSASQDYNDRIVKSEFQRLIDGTNLTNKEIEKKELFDSIINSLQINADI